jgi:mono/diheme cytochrome c family protein
MRSHIAFPVAASVIGALASLLILSQAGAGQADPHDFALVEKGRYLTTAADCMGCHTVPNSEHSFAGGRPIETPFGNITAANITPDRETGIGAWSDKEFDDAVRKGMRPDGSRLYPAMPYTAYAKMSADDVLAIRAYLNTVKPVHNPVESNTLPFPLNIRAAMHVWNALYFSEGAFKPDPQKSPEWNRGAYLVQGPGHCGACHTPKSFLGGDKANDELQGSKLQGWFAPNITNDKTRGLGRWSTDDIVAYLKTGHNRISAATGPMAEEVSLSSSKMHDGDLKAIAVYLKSLPGQERDATTVAANDPMMVAGSAIYRDQCSACHALDGHGVPHLFPSLADSSITRSDDPATLVRMILRGSRSVATEKEPTSPGMPSFAWQLNDAQVAAVATYLRNAWGSGASAMTADDVGRVRADLKERVD